MIYATALYAGLRLGELQALCWHNLDFETNLIHIEKSWDRHTGFITPKSRAGSRRIPITRTLRRELLNHKLQHGKSGKQGFDRYGHLLPGNEIHAANLLETWLSQAAS